MSATNASAWKLAWPPWKITALADGDPLATYLLHLDRHAWQRPRRQRGVGGCHTLTLGWWTLRWEPYEPLRVAAELTRSQLATAEAEIAKLKSARNKHYRDMAKLRAELRNFETPITVPDPEEADATPAPAPVSGPAAPAPDDDGERLVSRLPPRALPSRPRDHSALGIVVPPGC